jgi:hypothetical protein
MKITICSPATARERMTDTVVRDAAILESLDGSQYTDSGCNIADYLDSELADIGIIGGALDADFRMLRASGCVRIIGHHDRSNKMNCGSLCSIRLHNGKMALGNLDFS